jgi:hypothetical protein
MKQKTKILFLKEATNEPGIENNVIAYFPQQHKTAFKTNGKLFKTEEFPGVDMNEYERAEKSQYRNLLADLIVRGEKKVQVLNKK